jgi:hypothetical protein
MQVGDRHVARREAALTPLILKRGSASRSERRDDDYDVLERTASSWAAFSRCRSRRRIAPGCGRAATTATFAARRTATSQRERLRWLRSKSWRRD